MEELTEQKPATRASEIFGEATDGSGIDFAIVSPPKEPIAVTLARDLAGIEPKVYDAKDIVVTVNGVEVKGVTETVDLPPPKRRTLFEILTSLTEGEQELDRTGEVAPTTEADMTALRAKIDGYKKRIFDLEREASQWDGDIKFLEKELKGSKASRTALMNKALRDRNRIVWLGQLMGYEKLPGNDCRAVIVRASNPSANFVRPATPLDLRTWKEFPGLVVKKPATYEFDKAAYKELAKRIQEKIATNSATDEERTLLALGTLDYSYSVEFEPAQTEGTEE